MCMTMKSRLVVVTPAKDEEKFIAKCISSVLNQTYPITLHLIIDDYSTDKTREIAESFGKKVTVIASNLPKGQKIHGIRPILLKEIGVRKLAELVPDWKYCLILDADTWLPNDYCERLIGEMMKNPRLVMAGARFLKTPSELEVAPTIHVRGSNHIIRRDFYEKSNFGYTSIHGERMLERIAWIMGFETRNFPLTAFEGRPTGATFGDPIASGIYGYKLGSPILPFLFKLRNFRKNDFYELFGWLYAKLHHERRYFPRNHIKILYGRYLNSLLKSSARASKSIIRKSSSPDETMKRRCR
jgi:biofilm PGA synthesis N-glycosyltransferase PgaC